MYPLYLLAMIFGASISAGSGPIVLLFLVSFFGLTFIQANATDQISWFFLSIVSLIVFGINGLIDFWLGIAILIGMSIGGYYGVKVAVNKGNVWVRKAFVVVVVLSGLKLLFL